MTEIAEERGQERAETDMDTPPATTAYAWYVLLILVCVNAFNAVDRAMVSILVESIRAEFHFNDLQLGILSGMGFALFYAGLGIPIARWADSGNRRNILALGLAIWSGMTALTGRATGFVSMLAARCGVGVGEASCYPTAYPLISDYFPRSLRPIAMSLFQMGLFLGIVGGNIIAAQIAAAHGWRAAFTAIGLPGMALALLLFLTVREPERGRMDPQGEDRGPAQGSMADILGMLARDRRFLLVIIGTTLLTVASATLGNWGPALMMRVHAVSQADVGYIAAPIGVGGMLGTIAGGILGSLMAKKSSSEAAPLRVPIALSLLAVPGTLGFLLLPSTSLAVLCGALGAFAIAVHTGPVVAVAVSLAPPRMRGMASAFIVVGHLLVGFGLGPVVVGFLSDLLTPGMGREALRLAMLFAPACVLLGWAALLLAYRAIGRAEAIAG